MRLKSESNNPPCRVAAVLILLPLFMLGCAWSVGGHGNPRNVLLLDGMGDHHHPITTPDTLVQRLFDQGLVLAYGFNHMEAFRSFEAATRIDPQCAMCYWGMALVLGPNINSGMEPADAPAAYAAIQKAVELSDGASEREQAYIRALATRYAASAPENRTPLDTLYSDAMRQLSAQEPDDLDAATLFAESLMDLTPWDYWTESGELKPATQEVLFILDSVIRRDPDHPGALHLYIHIVEPVKPELGIAAADHLLDLVPNAGHLVHMPAHIYLRVGRYHDATISNQRAIEVDRAYLAQCQTQGLYPLAYVPHNYHFLAATASMEGRSALAIETARDLASQVDQEMMREPGLGTLQHYLVTPLYVYVRFGRWEEILKEPAPAADLLYPLGVWHYARGLAYLRTGAPEKGAEELEQLEVIAADSSLESVTIWDINTTASLMRIAVEDLAGEVAAAKGDYETALKHLRSGVELQDNLNYDEPPPWLCPIRETLGAVLLLAGRPAEAEQVYREDLKQFPENGWSLFGLRQALEAQNKSEQSADIVRQFEKAWSNADVTLAASRF